MKITSFYSIILSMALLVSCESELDYQPQDQLTQKLSFADKGAALGVLTGVYSAAQQDDVLNGTWQLAGEWQSDNVDFVGSFPTFNEIKLYTTLASNTSIAGLWDDSYETIGGANLVIKNIPLVEDPNFTDVEKRNAVAQAKFMRALVYFNLANWYAQPIQVSGGDTPSIPLVLEPFEVEVKFPSRASLSEVYAQIEKDLLEALPDLDDSDNSRATLGACQALLARLYLYQDDWLGASFYANEAINNTNYALATDYSFFNTQSSEFYFTLVNSTLDGQDSGQGFSGLSNPTPNGRGDTPYSNDLIQAFEMETEDLRYLDLTQEGNDANGTRRKFSRKFPDAINNSDNAPVLRVTEMYLTRAEANFRGGTSLGAPPLEDINRLRSRAGLPNLMSLSLDQILDERRKELCFEGHRRMDLLRNELNLRRAGQQNVSESAPGQNKVILPIPINELDLNDNLTQNPGY